MQKTEKLSSSEVTLVLQHHEVPRLSLDLKFKFSSFSIHFSLYSDQMTAVSSSRTKLIRATNLKPLSHVVTELSTST